MYGQGFFPGSRGPTWFVLQRRSPGDTTLSKPGDSYVVSLRLASYHYKLVYKLHAGYAYTHVHTIERERVRERKERAENPPPAKSK